MHQLLLPPRRAQAIPSCTALYNLSVAYVSKKPLSYEARVASSSRAGQRERESGIKWRLMTFAGSRNLINSLDCRPFHSHVWISLFLVLHGGKMG